MDEALVAVIGTLVGTGIGSAVTLGAARISNAEAESRLRIQLVHDARLAEKADLRRAMDQVLEYTTRIEDALTDLEMGRFHEYEADASSPLSQVSSQRYMKLGELLLEFDVRVAAAKARIPDDREFAEASSWYGLGVAFTCDEVVGDEWKPEEEATKFKYDVDDRNDRLKESIAGYFA